MGSWIITDDLATCDYPEDPGNLNQGPPPDPQVEEDILMSFIADQMFNEEPVETSNCPDQVP